MPPHPGHSNPPAPPVFLERLIAPILPMLYPSVGPALPVSFGVPSVNIRGFVVSGSDITIPANMRFAIDVQVNVGGPTGTPPGSVLTFRSSIFDDPKAAAMVTAYETEDVPSHATVHPILDPDGTIEAFT